MVIGTYLTVKSSRYVKRQWTLCFLQVVDVYRVIKSLRGEARGKTTNGDDIENDARVSPLAASPDGGQDARSLDFPSSSSSGLLSSLAVVATLMGNS